LAFSPAKAHAVSAVQDSVRSSWGIDLQPSASVFNLGDVALVMTAPPLLADADVAPVAVGAAFDFYAGLVPQAPHWVQALGMEWAYRLSREPKRLWRRYATYNPRFVSGFARQWVGRR